MKNERKKWYPVEYAGQWTIQNEPYYDAEDILNSENVGEDQAKKNAILAASAPDLLKALNGMLLRFEGIKGYGEPKDAKVIDAAYKIINKIKAEIKCRVTKI